MGRVTPMGKYGKKPVGKLKPTKKHNKRKVNVKSRSCLIYAKENLSDKTWSAGGVEKKSLVLCSQK